MYLQKNCGKKLLAFSRGEQKVERGLQRSCSVNLSRQTESHISQNGQTVFVWNSIYTFPNHFDLDAESHIINKNVPAKTKLGNGQKAKTLSHRC